MEALQVLDDDRRFEHGAAVVDQQRKPFHRPQRREFGVGLRIFEGPVFERRVVLVERDQYLLAIRRERMRIEFQRHWRLPLSLRRPTARSEEYTSELLSLKRI